MTLVANETTREEQSDNRAVTGFRVSPLWAGVALASLVVLGIFAPSGLLLLGFIGVIVITHEAGHYFFARRAGMEPTEFFWGFGPEIVGFDIGQCRYGIKAIFLGGYVKLWGMTPTSELPEGVSEVGTYRSASHRGRLATILGGPFVNLATAVLCFAAADLLDGAGFVEAIAGGFTWVWYVLAATAESLWIFVAELKPYLGTVFGFDGATEAPVRFMSPVAQATTTSEVVNSGLAVSLRWFAILSAAIGVVNLMPLPPLDGAHAMVAASEWLAQVVTRNRSIRFDVRRLEPVAYLTIGALVLLSLTALVLDVRELLV